MFLLLFFLCEVRGFLCSSAGRARRSHREHESFDSTTLLKMSERVMAAFGNKLQGCETMHHKKKKKKKKGSDREVVSPTNQTRGSDL